MYLKWYLKLYNTLVFFIILFIQAISEDDNTSKFLHLIHKVIKEGRLKKIDTLWTILEPCFEAMASRNERRKFTKE